MKKRVVQLGLMLTLFSLAILLSCGKSYNSSTSTGGGYVAPSPNAVSIVNMSFSASSLTVTAGTTVTWTNQDAITHTVTADDNSFDSGNIASKGTYSKVFSKAGTYTYHCKIHPGMLGTIVVK